MSETTVGIIANPASGKDIRRLVAHGSVFDNQEKVNIVRRVLLGLEAAGVEKVLYMPDYFGIVPKALSAVKLSMEVYPLDMPVYADQRDSTLAASLMAEAKVKCIITLGGDGTNRAVAKTCGDIPLVPISTGTNNVFPFMVEGTIAGLAAGVVAVNAVDLEKVVRPSKRLEVEGEDGKLVDIALVDVVVYDDVFIASRAIWDMSKVREIILARVSPSNIGLSSVGGCLYPNALDEGHGVYIKIGLGRKVLAPIAPGLIEEVQVESCSLISLGEAVEIRWKPSVLALDGEREVEVGRSASLRVRLTGNGPKVVDIPRALEEAARNGFFSGGRSWP